MNGIVEGNVTHQSSVFVHLKVICPLMLKHYLVRKHDEDDDISIQDSITRCFNNKTHVTVHFSHQWNQKNVNLRLNGHANFRIPTTPNENGPNGPNNAKTKTPKGGPGLSPSAVNHPHQTTTFIEAQKLLNTYCTLVLSIRVARSHAPPNLELHLSSVLNPTLHHLLAPC